MNLPELKRVNRSREYNSYSDVIRDNVVYHFLFKGFPHRSLDEIVIGLNADYSRGWQSMGILHFLGLRNAHKNLFNRISVDEAIQILDNLEDRDWSIISNCLKRNRSLGKKIIERNFFEKQFNDEVSKSRKFSKKERLEKIKSSPKKPETIEVLTVTYKRNPYVAAEILERAGGICEGCKSNAPFFRAKDGTPYLEVHHMIPLSKGGEDSLENAMALCPNCHRKLHFGADSN